MGPWTHQSCHPHPQWCWRVSAFPRQHVSIWLCTFCPDEMLFETGAISTAQQSEVDFSSFLFNEQGLDFWIYSLALPPCPPLLFPPVIYCLLPVSGEGGAKTSAPLLCFIDWLHLLNSSAPMGISSYPPPAKGNCIPAGEGGGGLVWWWKMLKIKLPICEDII